ncbi:MAG: DUF1847 domain-containing protein [Prolixibacteraceae bacterium]|nr:DUF1847 domain-containing protein [Prolixibacteraceae bacterium]
MNYKDLYNAADCLIMKAAEDSKNRNNNRIQEIIEYARSANLKKIGIANCTTFTQHANTLEQILINEGFEVAKANCKLGRVAFSDLVEGYKGISCNPAGQAKLLAEAQTELNITMGLCLGHDMVFNMKSEAPVTNLIVKERKGNVKEELSK